MDSLVVGLIFCRFNAKKIFNRIFLPQILGFTLIYFIFISLYGQFNLTFFLSDDGKTFLLLTVFILMLVQTNTVYQALKLSLLQDLSIQPEINFLKVLFFNLVRIFILITPVVYFKIDFILVLILIIMTFLLALIYSEIFKVFADQVDGSNLSKRYIQIKFFLYTLVNLIVLRLIWIIIFITALLSILLPWEFIRILVSEGLFFFLYDRLLEIKLFGLYSLILIIILNSIYYILFFSSLKNYSNLLNGVYVNKVLGLFRSND